MITILNEASEVTIPEWEVDINIFRRWTGSKDYLDTGRIWWLKAAEVSLDMGRLPNGGQET
jgi:hypothetical protein